MQWPMLWHTLNCGQFSVGFDRHDRQNQKIESCALSTQNYLVEKNNEVNCFCCIIRTRILFRWKDGYAERWLDRQMMSSAIVANRVLTIM